MNIDENTTNSLILANNAAISDDIFKKLLENCFNVGGGGGAEVHNMANLYNSKPDLIKQLYGNLLKLIVQFVRNKQTTDDLNEYLTNKCNYPVQRIKQFCLFYEKYQQQIEISLINIGNHLPHITDIDWRIDYIIKSSDLDESYGPAFRIGLQTEQFDEQSGKKRIDLVNFTCTSQELQDLVYKLKDAIRHCQKIANEH